MGTMPTEYMGGLMAAIHSFLWSCCLSAANMGPSAVEATHAGSARASWGMSHLNMPKKQSHVPLTWLIRLLQDKYTSILSVLDVHLVWTGPLFTTGEEDIHIY